MRDRIFHQGFLPEKADSGVHAYVWKYSPVDGGRRPRHFHSEPELNLVVSGWAEFGVGESAVRVSKGELVGFPSGQDHVLVSASPDVFIFAVGLTGELSSNALHNQGHAALPLHLRPTVAEFDAITRRTEMLLEQTGIEQGCAELWEHVHSLGRATPAGRTNTLHVLTRRALQAVSESPELQLEAIAREARVNASEISRYFHRDLGMTFARYRTRLRLLRFINWEKERGGNWTTAAIIAGFGSYSQCHRSFQTELGCSPREFFRTGLRQEMQQAYDDDQSAIRVS